MALRAAPMMLSIIGTAIAFSATRSVSASVPLFSVCVSACVSAIARQVSATATLVAGDGGRRSSSVCGTVLCHVTAASA